MYDAHTILRIVVFAAFCLAALVALAGWLVRTRRVSPFGGVGRTLRSVTDPVLRPVETRLVRLGGNPVHAGWWLVVLVAVAGVLLLSLIDWLVRTARWFYAAATGGPGALFAFLVGAAYNLLIIALVVRVVASWLGWFRYSRWIRPAYALTDWLVEPIRRLLPPATKPRTAPKEPNSLLPTAPAIVPTMKLISAFRSFMAPPTVDGS